VARGRGVLTLVGSSDEQPERERELADAFMARGVDGLLVASSVRDNAYLLRERAAGLALAFVDRPPRFIDADAVVSDNVGGARAAVEHLIAAGHRRIGFLGDRPDVYTAAERLRGYREALAKHDLPMDPELVRHPRFRGVDAYQTTRGLLDGKDPPTAIFAGQNLISLGAVRAVHAAGLQHEIAFVSFDDIPLADVVRPGVTVVAQDPHALGRRAAELLFARLDGHEGPTQEIVVPTRLIERGSGELPPAR